MKNDNLKSDFEAEENFVPLQLVAELAGWDVETEPLGDDPRDGAVTRLTGGRNTVQIGMRRRRMSAEIFAHGIGSVTSNSQSEILAWILRYAPSTGHTFTGGQPSGAALGEIVREHRERLATAVEDGNVVPIR